MLRLLFLIAVLFALALGFHWLKDTSGEVALTLGGQTYAVDLTTATISLLAAIVAAVLLVLIVRAILRAPHRFARGWRQRNGERGRAAVSHGLIAIAAGDLRTAERATAEATRRTGDLPLTRLLQAQTAQLRGDRDAARRIFKDMTGDPATRIAGLRGLYVEAEREGEQEAAHRIAEMARSESPSAAWAARALLKHQTAEGDWQGALKTLNGAAEGRILDKPTARRNRAVILTGEALQQEDSDPDRARQAALEAHDLAPSLVPAAVVAGRLLSRLGDIRRATRVLEETWKAAPHPDIADAYMHVRAGDAALDRLKRAETLHRMRPHADEGRLAVARAAIDAREFGRAREALKGILTTRPTRNALLLMAELEESETGDRGRAREWTARAVHAPRDPAWIADGMILDHWAPMSPVSGRLDAVEWKTPPEQLERPSVHIDEAELIPIVREEPVDVPAADTAPTSEEPAEPAATAPGIPVGDDLPPPIPPHSAEPDAAAASSDMPASSDQPPKSASSGNGAKPVGAAEERVGDDLPPPVPPGEADAGAPDPETADRPHQPDDPGVEEPPAPAEEKRFRLF